MRRFAFALECIALSAGSTALYADQIPYGNVGTIAPTATQIEETLAGGLNKSEWTTLNRALAKLMTHAKSVLGDAEGEEEEE